MSVSRRVGAFLCALALVLHLAFVPLRARAFAGVLPAVAAGTVVTAFLMASGIYPYEEQKAFAEYVSDNLSSLWSQYLDWRTENSMNPPVTGNELSSLTGYLTQGVVAISRNVWNTLSEFTSWIVSHFSVADNQTGVELGGLASSYVLPSLSSSSSSDVVQSTALRGSPSDKAYSYYYAADSSLNLPAIKVCVTDGVFSSSGPVIVFGAVSSSALPQAVLQWSGASSLSLYRWNLDNRDSAYPDVVYRAISGAQGYDAFSTGVFPFFNSKADAFSFFGSSASSFSGITADTATVSPPATLPADTPWRGLAVEGAGTAPTVGGVEQVIQSGVTEREKPEVKVIEVELGANTDVDTETGAVTENPVVVTPESVVPAVSELIAPDSFVGMAVNALQTKFPFCLPFDVVRILQAFVVPPEAPVISLTFHDPFTDEDYSVTVDLSPWNEIAAVCRFMWSILLFVAFSLNVAKMFHIERGTGELFLGNVGSPGV